MPIYVYDCDACRGRFEYMQRMADAPKAVCEQCGGVLQRIIAPTAFHLKGGGWYKDLYSSSAPASKGSGSGDSSGGGKQESGGNKEGGGKKESGGTKESSGSKESGGKKESKE